MGNGTALLMGLLMGSGFARPPSSDRGVVETVEDLKSEEKTEEQKRLEEQLARLDDANRAIAARVVVLRWPNTDTDQRDPALQRNIKARVARPDARFFPEIDLYQAGRKEEDVQVRPTDQRAAVPHEAIGLVTDAVDAISTAPWDAYSVQDWGLRAHELRTLADDIWFVDRPELREPLFLLYTQIGRAAENANTEAPPYFESIGEETVNYHYYLAGALAHRDPELMSLLSTNELHTAVSNYKDGLDAGRYDRLPLTFDLTDIDFDPKQFATDYQLFINGIEVDLSNPDGVYEVPLGRADVYLVRRGGGHSMSDRIDQDRARDRFTFVLRNARKRMGLDFIDQLMAHPNECTPPVDGDILTYLSIYAKLHPRSEVYIAVPKGGSTAAGRIHLWRWDRPTASLVKVQDDTGGFPVRFVAMAGAGLAFSGAQYAMPTNEDLVQQLDVEGGGAVPDLPLPSLTLDGAPIQWELRGHYNRLMLGVGLQFKIGIGGAVTGGTSGAPYSDLFPTRNGDEELQVSGVPGSGVRLRERELQRLVYGLGGVVLGRDAAVGFGPRVFVRTGWANAPHAVDVTLHGGYAARVPIPGRADQRRGRVHPMVDADFFGGVLAPYHDSLFIDDTSKGRVFALGRPVATFGMHLAAGLTF